MVYEIGGDDDLLHMLLKNGADANLVEYVCFILTLSLVFLSVLSFDVC